MTDVTSYLEIGVEKGEAFRRVNIKNKNAVDPFLKFDYQGNNDPCIEFHEITSDDYFLNRYNGRKFDVIFLARLHTWDQTFRDLNNALLCTHSCILIVIDDVCPLVVFSSLRLDSLKNRLLHDPTDPERAWRGDVYKLLFFIHGFFPLLSYVKIDRGFGNPQSILHRKPRGGFNVRFGSAEKIDRLSFFDFLENFEILNLRSESDAMSILQDFVKIRSMK